MDDDFVLNRLDKSMQEALISCMDFKNANESHMRGILLESTSDFSALIIRLHEETKPEGVPRQVKFR